MKKWDVTVKRYYSIIVEAEDKATAKGKAEKLKELETDRIAFLEEIVSGNLMGG